MGLSVHKQTMRELHKIYEQQEQLYMNQKADKTV